MYLLYFHIYTNKNIVDPVGQTLIPSFGDILAPTSNNQLPPSLPIQTLNLQHSRQVHIL